jgi:hypothetical protein
LDYISSTLEGQHNAGVTSFYTYFREILKIEKQTEKFTGIIDLTQNCGWVYCYKDICFICDRHTKLNLDENGKLHSENDFAFQYPDGYGETYWHGYKIPQWIIFEKEKLTAAAILKEQNKEIQRCMMDIYGRDKLIKDEGKLIHSDDWGSLYHLPNFKDAFGKPIAYLEVVNFSPNETAFLKKSEIDEIILKVQKIVGNNGMMRHGDVILVSKKAKKYCKEQAEEKIKEFKRLVNQEINILMRKKQISGDAIYKKYFMQVESSHTTAYNAWQSLHRKLNIDAFLPITAS